MPQFTAVTSAVIPLPMNNIDTDQIIPARFLKVTDKLGLGQNLFADWRYDAQGAPRADFILNKPEHQGAQILLAGDNFGCGSSREHAPWALTAWGIRAIIATSFGDIFRSNALKNGLVPVVVDPQAHAALAARLAADPGEQWTVDLDAEQVRLANGAAVAFTVDSFARACLLQGVDELGYIQSFSEQIEAFERATGRA